MRKLSMAALATTATFAIGGVAAAQVTNEAGDATFNATVAPSDFGTKKKPKSVTLTTEIEVARPGTTVEFIELTVGKGLAFSGKGFKKCSKEALEAEGTAACPRGSSIGPQGVAFASIEPGNAPLNFDVFGFVEDANTFNFYLAQQGGGVQAVVQGEITNSGRKLRITIPLSLRQPAGLDATLTSLEQTFKGKAGKNSIVSSTSCKGGKVKVGGTLIFATRANGTPGPAPESLVESVRCKK